MLTLTEVHGTGYQGSITASYSELKSIFGGDANQADDEDKCYGMAFGVTNDKGQEIALWPWKAPCNPKHNPDHQIAWSYGSPKRGDALDLSLEIEEALKNLRSGVKEG